MERRSSADSLAFGAPLSDRSTGRTSRRWSTLIALSAYVLLAIAATWPLAARLQSHLPGPPTGDTGVYVWNLWVFHHEITVHHRSPLETSKVFSLTTPADLSLHNYTPLPDLLAFPLISRLGPVATFNLLLIVFLALNGWATFLLARHVTGHPLESWLGGALFAISPVIIARTTAHFSLVAAFPLPLVALATLLSFETKQARYAVTTGALVAMAGFCDAYFAVYAVLIIAGLAAARMLSCQWSRRDIERRAWLIGLDVVLAVLSGLVVVLLTLGGRTIQIAGFPVAVKSLYTPMLLLTIGIGARLIAAWRPRVSLTTASVPTLLRFGSTAALVCVFLMSPTLLAVGRRIADGRFDRPATHWRSSPPGVDLLAFLMPNPNHPLYGGPYAEWLSRTREDGFAELTASLPFVALVVIGWAVVRRRQALPAGWLGLAALFGAMALGPFVHVAGFNTHIPGPWALLRYVPLLELARSPSRFAILLALAIAILFAAALRPLRESCRRPALLTAGLTALLVFELLPAPRTLVSANVPAVYDIVRANPDHHVRVLDLPTGVRDGVSSLGNFSAASQFFQTHHGKRLMGGYLSRVSGKRKRDMTSLPVYSALVTLSEGGVLTPEQEARAWQGRGRFLRRSHLGYVVMRKDATPDALRRFAIELFELELVADQDAYQLYRPRTELIAGLPPPTRHRRRTTLTGADASLVR